MVSTGNLFSSHSKSPVTQTYRPTVVGQDAQKTDPPRCDGDPLKVRGMRANVLLAFGSLVPGGYVCVTEILVWTK